MLGPIDQSISLKLLQSQAKHALGDAQISLQLIEAKCFVLGKRNDHQNTPAVTNTRQDFVDPSAIGALD